MTRQVELRIDVSAAANLGEPAHVAASVVLPEPDDMIDRPLVCFATPSSSYSRGYYTCELPGPAQGAQAQWHARRRWIFVAMDLLGCGDSSVHDPDSLDFETLSAATHAAGQEVLLRLANGVLADGYPPVNQPVVIGIGQSMGGSLVIYQQARHHSYDGIGVLGFSAVRSHPSTPPGEAPLVVGWYPRDMGRDMSDPLNAEALEDAGTDASQDAAWKSLGWGFHYDDVPEDVVAEDLRHYEAIARGLANAEGEETHEWYSTATPGVAARSTLTPGVVASEAAAITVPVLSAMGVRDLVPDPLGEARAFLSARSFDLFVCPRMGHMHNFASTRALLWERIDLFGQWCAAVKETG
jgi:pimeloyl-ACP methyl ester carboxylesterase